MFPESCDEGVDLGLGEPQVGHLSLPAEVAGNILPHPLDQVRVTSISPHPPPHLALESTEAGHLLQSLATESGQQQVHQLIRRSVLA